MFGLTALSALIDGLFRPDPSVNSTSSAYKVARMVLPLTLISIFPSFFMSGWLCFFFCVCFAVTLMFVIWTNAHFVATGAYTELHSESHREAILRIENGLEEAHYETIEASNDGNGPIVSIPVSSGYGHLPRLSITPTERTLRGKN